MSDIPTWDPATLRLVVDVAARWRTTITVAFEGDERMRTVVTQTAPTTSQLASWQSCPGASSTELASGESTDIMEQIQSTTLEIKPFNSGGTKCGPPGVATLRFSSATKVDEEIVVGLISNAHTATTSGGDTVYIIIVIRDEGGAGNTAPSAAAQTTTIATRLGLDLSKHPHRTKPVPAGRQTVPI